MNDEELRAIGWDEAVTRRLATARGFTPLGVAPATVRKWASQGLLEPVGKAPGGAYLYRIAEVSAVADRPKQQPGRPAKASSLARR